MKEKDELIATMTEYRRLANAEKYEPKTEQVQYLFPELETIMLYGVDGPEGEAGPGKEGGGKRGGVPGKARKPRRPVLTLPRTAPVVECRHYADGQVPETKVVGGVEYRRCEDKVVVKAGHVPASSYVEVHRYAQYKAVHGPEGGAPGRIADMPCRDVDGMSCAPSLVAEYAESKYDDHMALYRQEEKSAREGFPVSRQQMCRWLLAYYSALASFDLFFSAQVFRMNLVAQDETPCKVLSVRSPDGKASSSSFVVIRVGTTFDRDKRGYRRIVSMSYIHGRARDKLLDGFGRNGYRGPLQSDGLKGYYGTGEIDQGKHAGCWAHAARPLKKYARRDPGESHVFRILSLYGQLAQIEKKYRRMLEGGGIDAETFLSRRKEDSTKVIDEIYKVVDGLNGYVLKDPLAKAVAYLNEYRDHMRVYLDYVECTPDNNECERRAKAFAVGRKNWLFNQTVDGIDASCFYYSLVETAKACSLNPKDYLEYVFTRVPYARKEDYGKYLPWNLDMQDYNAVIGRKLEAAPDPDRTEDYILAGFRR